MRPLLQHASRSLLAGAVPSVRQLPWRTTVVANNFSTTSTSELCLRCQLRASSAWAQQSRLNRNDQPIQPSRRQFSSSRALFQEKKPSEPSEPLPETTPSPPQASDVPPRPRDAELPKAPKASTSNPEKPIVRVPAEDLPSHRKARQWSLLKRATEIMDELLPKLAIVTQKVNTYTGTDYSSINSLRQEIKDQEKLVKNRRNAIEEAKQALDSAHNQQAAAQKEVVALLERKHSWSATDLERYMALIRSEHVNDQAVREAKDAVLNAENALEEARTQLEKRERAQYHEEQIWSDTIRRNSTWVTFGLMGLNIFLLLVSLLFIEPWRRRRMVREIKSALDAQKTAIEAAAATQPAIPIEIAIDEVVEPAGKKLEDLTAAAINIPEISALPTPPIPEIELHSSNPEVDMPAQTRRQEANLVTSPVIESSQTPANGETSALEKPETVAAIDIEQEVKENTTWPKNIIANANDLMSDRYISIRKKDLTNAVLEGAAIGAVVTAVVLQVLFRSR